MFTWVRLGAAALIPPIDAQPDHVYKYRLGVSSSILTLIVVVTAHIALACGYLPFFFSGFARAADLHSQRLEIATQFEAQANQILQIQLLQIRAALRRGEIARCQAIAGRNQPALDYANLELLQLREQYIGLTNSDYSLLPCDVVLVNQIP